MPPTLNGASTLKSASNGRKATKRLLNPEAASSLYKRARIQALSAHHRRSYERLRRQALGMVGSREAADDIVQEAFANTAEAIEEGTEIDRLSPWLKRCVRNLAIKYLQQRSTVPLQDELGADGYDVPAELAYANQRCKDVYSAINELAPAQKSALVLSELRGLSYNEIATAMDRTTGSVRQLISRARVKLNDALSPRRALSLTVPLLFLLDAEARGHVQLGARASLQLKHIEVRSYLLSKFVHLRALAARSSPHAREIGGAHATAIAASVLVLATVLGPASTEKKDAEQRSDGGAPVAAATPLVSESASPPGKSGGAPPTGAPTAGKLPQAAVSPASDSDRTPTGGNGGGGGNGGNGGSDGNGGTRSPSDPGGTDTPQPGGGNQTGVAVAVTDPGGAPEDPTLAPENETPPSISSVSGAFYVGSTVTCSGDTWHNNPTRVSYEFSDGSIVSLGANPELLLKPEHSYTFLSCSATAYNNAGSSGTAVSNPIFVIGVPVNTSPPTITLRHDYGPPGVGVGDVLACHSGKWNYWDYSPANVRYRFSDGTVIPVGETPELIVQPWHVGTKIQCSATTYNLAGPSIPATSGNAIVP